MSSHTREPAPPSDEPEKAAPFTESVLRRLTLRSVAAGRYEIRGEIARGGMGVVLRVWDEDLRRNLAMKVILGRGEDMPSGATPPVDARQLARFLEEAQVTGQLDHPGIVPVHELGLDASGQVYFTMKLVKGQTLKEVLASTRDGKEGWTRTRVLGILLKVCEAMAFAHHKGVIHRDLKPGNVMVGKYGEVYVMDWGLARVLGQADARDVRIRPETVHTSTVLRSERVANRGDAPDSPLFTMDGDVVGTPAYMSPEQARGDRAAMGPHSDVYALGAMLYHLLAGHMPYVPRGARLNAYAIWSAVQAGPPPRLSTLVPEAPAELVAICEKAMAPRVGDRYADMSELGRDLSAFLEGRVVRAYETGPLAELKKWAIRNKAAAGALALTFLALLAVLVLQFQARSRDRRTAMFLQEIMLLGDPYHATKSTLKAKLERVAGEIDHVLAGNDSAQAHARLAVGRMYWSLGAQEQAEVHLRRSLAAREAVYGEASREVADAQHVLAHVLSGKDPKRARELLEQVLLRLESASDRDPTEIVRLKADLAQFFPPGSAEASASLYECYAEVFGTSPANAQAEIFARFGEIRALLRTSQPSEAVQRVVAWADRLRNDSDLGEGAARALLGLADWIRAIDVDSEDIAEVLLRAAGRLAEDTLRPSNPDWIPLGMALGALELRKDALPESERCFRKAWVVADALYGRDDLTTLDAMEAVATVLELRGFDEEAHALTAQLVLRTPEGELKARRSATLERMARARLER